MVQSWPSHITRPLQIAYAPHMSCEYRYALAAVVYLSCMVVVTHNPAAIAPY